jgi:hypothetical protein
MSRALASRPRTEWTAYLGILSSAVAVGLVLFAPWPAATLAGALVLICVPAGAAVTCWMDAGDGAAQAGITLGISLAVVAVFSAIMIWAAAWHPHALLALAAVSSVSCAARAWWGSRPRGEAVVPAEEAR